MCTQAGRLLTEREKVSAQIISNWFANKRKELKKLAREGLLCVFLPFSNVYNNERFVPSSTGFQCGNVSNLKCHPGPLRAVWTCSQLPG